MISETAYNSECQLRDLSFGREPVEVPLLETSNLQRDSLLANFQEYTPVCVIHASYTLEIRERLSASHARRCNDSQQEDEGRSDDGDDVVRDSSCDSQDASTSQGCLCLAECGSLLHDRTDREPRSKKRRTSSPPFDEAMVTCLPGSACGCVEEYGNFYSWISTLNRSQEKKDDGEDDEKRSRRVAILNFEAIPPKHVLRECDSSCDCLKSSSNRAGLVAWSESHETKIYGGGRMPTSPGRRASDAEEDTALRRPLRGIRCANRVVGAGLGLRLEVRPSCLKRTKDETWGGDSPKFSEPEQAMETGLGLFAATSIIKGQFVCEYAGELISDREASKRWQQQIEAIVGTSDEREGGEGAIDEPSVERPKSEELESDPQAKVATVSGSTFGTSAPKGTGDNYILTLKEYTSDGDHLRTNIDPRSTGNLARFINHSCLSNLFILPVRCDPPLLIEWEPEQSDQGKRRQCYPPSPETSRTDLLPGVTPVQEIREPRTSLMKQDGSPRRRSSSVELDPTDSRKPSSAMALEQRVLLYPSPPRAAIFAKRDIKAGEELTFDYGDAGGWMHPPVHSASSSKEGQVAATASAEVAGITEIDQRPSLLVDAVSSTVRKRCLCGTYACRGWMPFEPSLT